jgi:spermidine/putrescine-binding protein
MNFMLDPQNQAALSKYSGYLSPDRAAMAILNDPALNSTIPTDAQAKYGHFIMDLGAFDVNYEDAWTKVKSS